MGIYTKVALCLFWLSLGLSSSLAAQDLKTFDVEENTSLDAVLSKISVDNDVLFAYPTDLVENVKVQNLNFEYDSNSELISEILKQTNLEMYAMNEQHFLLRQKEKQQEAYISLIGTITDSLTDEPLPFATIYQKDLSVGVFTDSNGQFVIKCKPEDDIEFVVSFLGYEDMTLSLKDIQQFKSIKLKQRRNVLDDIMITYVAPPSMISEDGQYIRLGDKLINASTSGLVGSDLLRNMQLMAGVSAHEDDLASLKIRGSNAEGSKIILDGIPLYNVSHYYGIFSSINTKFVDEAQLYKNAQPTQYKDASGGLLILNSNNSDANKDNIIDINLLTASAYFEEQLTDKIKFTVAGRSSYRNVNDARLIDIGGGGVQQFVDDRNENPFFTSQPKFKFFDINGSIKYKSKNLSVSANVFRSEDELINFYDRISPGPTSNNPRTVYTNFERWTNTGFSILSSYNIKNNWTLKSNLYTSNYDYFGMVDSELIANQKIQSISNDNFISLRETGADIFGEKKTASSKLLGGVSVNSFEARHLLIVDENTVVSNYKDDFLYTTFFGEYERRIDKIVVKAGMRLPLTKQKDKLKFFYSPLVSVTYHLNNDQRLKASYNYSNQIVREVEYENRLGQNFSFYRLSKGKIFPVLKTHKFMLGYSATWSKFTFDVEAYYKDINGAMQLLNPLTGFDASGNGPSISNYLLFVGKSRVMGIDFTLGYQFDKLYSGLAYTLSKSEDKYNGLFKGKYFASQNDRRHQLKWINNLRLNNFDFNLNVIYANGRPYIPFENLQMINGKSILDRKNQKQMPAYFRLDIGGNYNFKISKIDANVGISIFNLTNRQNVKYVQYSHQINGNGSNSNDSVVIGTGADLIDRTLNLNFGISF